MIRNFLIKILLRLIDFDYNDVSEENIDKILASLHSSPGFQDYIYKRNQNILQHMGQHIDREKYIELIGRRLELNKLKQTAKIKNEKYQGETFLNS